MATQQAADATKKEKIVRLINSVISKVEHTNSADVGGKQIYSELKALKDIIDESRREIGMALPGDVVSKDTKDELDAVIEATATASGTIMDACERVQELAGAMGPQGEAIIAEVTKIFEACSFQDITGQRIRKVVKTLQSVEERVSKLVNLLREKMNVEGEGEKAPVATGDAALLNGPQLPGNAISQEDIDKLLKEFD